MLKNYEIIKEVASQVSAAADDAATAVLSDYSNLVGREEEVTAQLRGEINRQMLKNVVKTGGQALQFTLKMSNVRLDPYLSVGT